MAKPLHPPLKPAPPPFGSHFTFHLLSFSPACSRAGHTLVLAGSVTHYYYKTSQVVSLGRQRQSYILARLQQSKTRITDTTLLVSLLIADTEPSGSAARATWRSAIPQQHHSRSLAGAAPACAAQAANAKRRQVWLAAWASVCAAEPQSQWQNNSAIWQISWQNTFHFATRAGKAGHRPLFTSCTFAIVC